MKSNQSYKELLIEASLNGEITLSRADSNDRVKFCHFLYVNKLLLLDGDSYKLDKLGYDFLKSGLDFDKWEASQKENTRPLHIGHNINAPVSQSDFSNRTDNSLNVGSQNKSTTANGQRKSIPDIVYWILGALASVATIWGLLHELHITIKF